MSLLTLSIPDSGRRRAEKLAMEDGTSMDQFVASALAEKVAVLDAGTYIQERAARASRAKFQAVLSKVPDAEPESNDRMNGSQASSHADKPMKNILSVIAVLFVLVGCATTPQGSIMISPEVRKMSKADDTLFLDLMTKPGGVAHADMVFYPRSQRKTLAGIKVLTPYDNRQTGQERWFIQHESGETAAYLVRLIPDGKGGTTYTVQRD